MNAHAEEKEHAHPSPIIQNAPFKCSGIFITTFRVTDLAGGTICLVEVTNKCLSYPMVDEVDRVLERIEIEEQEVS